MNDIIRTLQFEKEQLEAKNRLLQEKIESDNRQISEYDHELRQAKRLLKAAVEDFWVLGTMLEDGYGNCTAETSCGKCVLGGGNLADDCRWRYTDEALALIGEEGGNNA